MSDVNVYREARAIGVVIVAYQSSDLLSDCIRGALIDDHVSSIVVVDNSSSSKSAAIVAGFSSADSRVKYLDPLQNLGFAKGCNRGVAALTSWTHVFFVNPDVQLTEPLAPLVDVLEKGRHAIVAGRLMTPEHANSINARKLVSWPREFAKALFGSRVYSHREAGALDRSIAPTMVGQVDGALLGVRKKTFAILSGFDEQFELYYEDVDLCARAAQFGGCVFVPAKWGIHVGGASSSTASGMSYCVARISRMRYLRKRYGSCLFTNAAIVALAALELLARSITQQPEGSRVRSQSFRQQWAELRAAGSVQVLK